VTKRICELLYNFVKWCRCDLKPMRLKWQKEFANYYIISLNGVDVVTDEFIYVIKIYFN